MDLITSIDRYHRHLRLKIMLRALLAVIGYLAAYFFFCYVVTFFSETKPWIGHSAGFIGCLILTASTFRRAQREIQTGGIDSFMASRLAEHTSGAIVLNHYAGRVTGPAVILASLFETGPKSLLRIRELLMSFISIEIEFINKITVLARTIREKEKWHSLEVYLEHLEEISSLALLDLIDLDVIKGRIKAK